MTITSIRAQQRNPKRVSVALDGKYAFSLDLAQVAELGVRVGLEVDAAEEAALLAASEFGKVYARALEWLLTRPHSERELRDYLWRKKVAEAQIETVVERLLKRGYVDDVRFAKFWVENRFLKKGVSSRRLQLELRRKGVTDEVIQRALEESERDDYAEGAKMVAKQRGRYSDEQLVAYLTRQGFDRALAEELLIRETPDF